MVFSELIRGLGDRLNVEMVADEENICALEADGMALSIHGLDEVGAVALVGDVGEPPPERLERLYRTMLEANHLFSGTAGATLSLDRETKHFTLCRTLPQDTLDVEGLASALERFLNVLASWRSLVADYREHAPADEAEDDRSASSDEVRDMELPFPGLGNGFMSV